ncbi:helix-turn-helix domain-containing protein [Actinoplanes bogorensis]|uniref:Helix-turn-helix domain-containing protein n=1 Tax=Paractinoplanes bogorensis TaxID=1610840 RepID=A0ABS5Z001_9ACTN|nr:helix-turn-helix transcriptional regulator [Actinoplanes bogorensis]MBU2669020.1 helix-turn-helix domain-containing protein [Actinoplanes bogorensis]
MELSGTHGRLVAELRALRAETGLTLRELSLKTHVSDSSLSRYFTGQALPPWAVVATLADLGGGDHTRLQELWALAQRERKQSRWPKDEVPPRRLGPVAGVFALMAASGALGWALGRRLPGRSRRALPLVTRLPAASG